MGVMFIDPRNVGEVCSCLECQAALATTRQLPIVRVPAGSVPGTTEPVWLHGEPLVQWHDKRQAFLAVYREATAPVPKASKVLQFQRLGAAELPLEPEPADDLPLDPDDLPLED